MINLGIVGCTGAVGLELMKLIELRNIKYNKLKILASSKSVNRLFVINNNKYYVEELNESSFNDLDIAIFSIDTDLSKKYIKIANNNNCMVIDNSSAFRMDENVPLVVPEINMDNVKKSAMIIANPNCSTILLNLVLYPIHKINPIKRIVVSTYQAASGAGCKAMKELQDQAISYSKNNLLFFDKTIFGRQYLWNIFSHNSDIDPETGYNKEELKMINETRKIFNDDSIDISVTCIRVPVLRAHCESVNITLSNPMEENELREILSNVSGVKILDDRINNRFPEPLIASNDNNVYVGRIRKDLGNRTNTGFEMFISGDQLLKGAALNAIQILEKII
tara:strand:- start:1187 stop:2194 length:1008 start_codon:yes stop_codon:yes gene_type:complete